MTKKPTTAMTINEIATMRSQRRFLCRDEAAKSPPGRGPVVEDPARDEVAIPPSSSSPKQPVTCCSALRWSEISDLSVGSAGHCPALLRRQAQVAGCARRNQ